MKALCEEGLGTVGDGSGGRRQTAATVRLTCQLGTACWSLGQNERAYHLFREAHVRSEEIGDWRVRHASLMMMAAYPHHLGRYEEAVDYLRRATAMARETGDLRYEAWCLSSLSDVLCTMGRYGEAEGAAQEASRIRQEIDDRAGTADSLVQLARIAIELEDYESARDCCQRALHLAQEAGDPYHRYIACNGLGAAAHGARQYAEARRWYEEGLATARKMSESRTMRSLIGLGHVALAMGEVERSNQCFCQALELAIQGGRMLEAMDALAGLADLLTTTGEPERAAELSALVQHHAATTQTTRDRAEGLLAEHRSQLAPDAFAAATARGQARQVQEMAAEILKGRARSLQEPEQPTYNET
jgi:tetratricopeptide (TPR) repeat protein